jgi:hypothetical protein
VRARAGVPSARRRGTDSPGPDPAFSIVRGDPPFRVQRALGLIPAHGLGVGRRALLATAITWLPVVVAVAIAGRIAPGSVPEALLQHFGVHVRLLLGLPVLILGEALLETMVARVIPQFTLRGLVTAADRPRLDAILRSAAAWRDDWRPWAVMAALVFARAMTAPTWGAHELAWVATDPDVPALGFAGAWFRFVGRPLFTLLALGWLWRLVILTVVLGRIARLDLDLVPTHADRAGGLGFLEIVPGGFAPLTFTVSAVLAALWAHDAVYHGVPLSAFLLPLALFALAAAALLLLPLAVCIVSLGLLRRWGELEYGALVARHGRAVRRRWILGEPVPDDALLSAPELGPVADTVGLFEAVERTRPAPIGTRTLILVALPILLPMAPLIAVEVPLTEALMTIVKTLL